MPTSLEHPAVSAALSTAATLLGMEVVFVGGLTQDRFTFERVHGDWPGLKEGETLDRLDTFCHRLLAGAPVKTSNAAEDPIYRDSPARERYQITSYCGVPVRNPAGEVVATLCGIDHDSIEVADATIGVLRELAQIISAYLGPLEDSGLVIRRTPDGWAIEGEQMHDLTSAMVLADLITNELSPPGRPPRPEGDLDELSQLRLSVRQLEHALAARVVVEQAIGVLTERQHTTPREAFERLRRVARSRGRKVHDLAREVVASSCDPAVPLPPELAGRPR